jgi:SNF2 family DNA or RNA helicase
MSDAMLNFRKLKQDFSSGIIKDGRQLFDESAVVSAKIIELSGDTVRISSRVLGNYENHYECEIEIDRIESDMVDSNCDCPYEYDCQHLAALLFHLEVHFDEILIAFSKEVDIDVDIDADERSELLESIKIAETKAVAKRGEQYQKELLEEYVAASEVLGRSPFFLPEENLSPDKAELAVIFSNQSQKVFDHHNSPEVQLSLRLPYRSKPLNINNVIDFLAAVKYKEPIYLSGKKYFFTLESFDEITQNVLKIILEHAHHPEAAGDRSQRIALIKAEVFGLLLAETYDKVSSKVPALTYGGSDENESPAMPCLYSGSLEQPLYFGGGPAKLHFELQDLEFPAPKLFIHPVVVADGNEKTQVENCSLFECAKPGMIYKHTYYRFSPDIKRKHLRHLELLRDIAIPEPLFGTFIENALPQLLSFGDVSHSKMIDKFVTLPYVDPMEACCDISYLNGELEASLYFLYDSVKVPAAPSQLNIDSVTPFVKDEGILARNLTEEQKIIEDLFQDFVFDASQGIYFVKSDKKIVEFMTEVIPRYQDCVTFNCPENLLDQFIYDESTFTLKLTETERIDEYQVTLKVDGHLAGITVDQLWECVSSKRAFIELQQKTSTKGRGTKSSASKMHKILVLDLERLAPVVQIFDEIGIKNFDNHQELRPLWSLANIEASQFKDLPIKFSMSKKLKEVQKQMLGRVDIKASPVPKEVNAKLRNYQKDGVDWLERLRYMCLNGILADDMGLGKTLQAIVGIMQNKLKFPDSVSIVVCPTSLIYNWKEEISKFASIIQTQVVDGTPVQRKKLAKAGLKKDIIITSYTLLQKDVDLYKNFKFSYAILDEAQHIKNRGTRNAKSVKMLDATHRLILTGTPIENSLDELWSLFDFLMPGFLSSYDRFVEKYIRNPACEGGKNLEVLRNKVSPFIMRRMKKDVLKDLPPVSENVYHCHLSNTQKELYTSYAEAARKELSRLVKKQGFDKVQIHVLATLTRLKQICCHPAIVAKEKVEEGDSAKYDMLLELLQTLIEGNHKTVIFSQYTRMLKIMREDLQRMGIRLCYLDGMSKNRMEIVKEFNEDESISVFLVSLKAGGTGLNLVGADTVIHYDMWWNPAVENQATDRVHRIGQTQQVSSYKLVTLGTIEEKIVELQQRKRGLVKQLITCDDDAIAKLTWEEVLELLQT